MALIQIVLLIILAAALTALLFRKRFKEEWDIIRRKEEYERLDKNLSSFFIPLTRAERTKEYMEHLQFLEGMQERLEGTFFAKYFINYRESIERQRNHIQQSAADASDGTVSFSTRNLHQITASCPPFTREGLVACGKQIDAHFEKTSIEIMIVSLEEEQGKVTIRISTCGDHPDEGDKASFQKLAVSFRESLFKGKGIEILVEVAGEDGSEQETLRFY